VRIGAYKVKGKRDSSVGGRFWDVLKRWEALGNLNLAQLIPKGNGATRKKKRLGGKGSRPRKGSPTEEREILEGQFYIKGGWS